MAVVHLPPGGQDGHNGGGPHDRLVQVPVFRQKQLPAGAVGYPGLSVQDAPVVVQRLFPQGGELLHNSLVPQLPGMDPPGAELFQHCRLIGERRRGQRLETLQGLSLLLQAPGQNGAQLRNVLLRELVEGILRAARAVKDPDHVPRSASAAGGGNVDAAPADTPGAVLVRHCQHRGVGVRLPQGADQLLQARLDLVNDLKHAKTSLYIILILYPTAYIAHTGLSTAQRNIPENAPGGSGFPLPRRRLNGYLSCWSGPPEYRSGPC